jgi:ribosome-binding factor A
MSSRRVQKAAQAIREVVSMAILTDLNDPRVQNVTVTYVEVSADLREAKVHVSIMGDETKQRLSLAGLRSAAGYLQSKISDQIETRYVPKLQFHLDLGVKKSIEMAEILRRVLPADAAAATSQTAPSDAAASDIESDDVADDQEATDEFEDDFESTDETESDDKSREK